MTIDVNALPRVTIEQLQYDETPPAPGQYLLVQANGEVYRSAVGLAERMIATVCSDTWRRPTRTHSRWQRSDGTQVVYQWESQAAQEPVE